MKVLQSGKGPITKTLQQFSENNNRDNAASVGTYINFQRYFPKTIIFKLTYRIHK